MTTELLKAKEVAKQFRVCLETLKGWHKLGYGPERLTVGPKLVRYRAEDVEAHINNPQ
jgi:predicted site-specific integrase-resolvase